MEVAPGITMIDTLLGGEEEITAAYLVGGTSPALVETGARTSVDAVRTALTGMGLGPTDLAWIVLTHIHLDHCGGVGDLAEAFPKATVAVKTRGARHLVAPERLVAASAAVYGDLAPMYGGLRAVPEGRILAVEGGARIALGGSRELLVVDAPGHARHHVALLDEATGALIAGDALGVQFPGSGLYPALPPPEFDRDASLATLDALAALDPEVLLIGHFGPVRAPREAIAAAQRQQALVADAALAAWRQAGEGGVDAAVQAVLPLASTVADPEALRRWGLTRWSDNTTAGLVAWAERISRTEASSSGAR